MTIDRIARAMVTVEPSADLEARIRTRIREAQPARGAAWWSWRIVAPVAAAAVVALVLSSPGLQVGSSPGLQVGSSPGLQVPRSPGLQVPSSPGLQVPRSAGLQVPRSAGLQVPRSAGLQVPSSPGPQVPSSPGLQVRKSQLSAEELAWMERRIPALDPMIALHVGQLLVDSIQPEPLTITPLTMTPVGTDNTGTSSGAL